LGLGGIERLEEPLKSLRVQTRAVTSLRQRFLAIAVSESTRLRLRPILMTAFAFILGCVPLWTAAGSGAASRQILGTTVIGGMLAATFVSIFLIPVLFYLVGKISRKRPKAVSTPPEEAEKVPTATK
jgi:hydrophobic/amphiphilic exporter-1 (mainly G- bacteria), HAE1 family